MTFCHPLLWLCQVSVLSVFIMTGDVPDIKLKIQPFGQFGQTVGPGIKVSIDELASLD